MPEINIIVTKASGEQVEFSTDKLKDSLRKSGADNRTIDFILEEIKKNLYEGITTKKIYKLAFSLLKKESNSYAARYKLKTAIMELGPSGFPFEKFFASLLAYKGYKTQVGVMVEGHCVRHEIDVIAEKGNEYIMVECKYHNINGIACDVKIPLYIQSRFKDVEFNWKKLPNHKNKNHQGWLVTNTKFTEDAIKYGQCMGLNMIGWSFPISENLKSMIDDSGLYPITCLTTITKYEKQLLLDKKIVLCKEICNKVSILKVANIPESRYANILKEAQSLINV
jgi:hypothetical protein